MVTAYTVFVFWYMGTAKGYMQADVFSDYPITYCIANITPRGSNETSPTVNMVCYDDAGKASERKITGVGKT